MHGPAGGFSIEETLANIQSQSATAQQFCANQLAAGIHHFGCPVQYNAEGSLPLSDR